MLTQRKNHRCFTKLQEIWTSSQHSPFAVNCHRDFTTSTWLYETSFNCYKLNGIRSLFNQDLDDGSQVDVLYTDFSGTFYRVNHAILCKKLLSLKLPRNIYNSIEGSTTAQLYLYTAWELQFKQPITMEIKYSRDVMSNEAWVYSSTASSISSNTSKL